MMNNIDMKRGGESDCGDVNEYAGRTVDKVLEDKIVQIKLDEITKSVLIPMNGF